MAIEIKMNLNEELYNAVFQESNNRVIQLIQRGANVNAQKIDGRTILHRASERGDYDICNTLLQNGALPNVLTEDEDTPLTVAIERGHSNVVRLLLESGADPNLKTGMYDNALCVAIAASADERIFTRLIQHGADVNIAFLGQTPLHWACKRGHKSLVETLLLKRANIYALNSKNQKPVDIAQNQNYKEIVDLLNPNRLLRLRLHHASEQGNYDECETLLEQCYSHYSDKSGSYCPITAASEKGHFRIVQLLLEKGIKFSNKCNNGRNALYLAAKNGHKNIASLLLEKGANANIRVKGETLLHMSVQSNNEDLVRLLLEKIESPNVKNYSWLTPLHYAAMKGYGNIVSYLLEHGADVNVTSNRMMTALHFACQKGHKKTVQILLQNGANTEALHNGHTPLHYAKVKGFHDIVNCLKEHDVNAYLVKQNANANLSTAKITTPHGLFDKTFTKDLYTPERKETVRVLPKNPKDLNNGNQGRAEGKNSPKHGEKGTNSNAFGARQNEDTQRKGSTVMTISPVQVKALHSPGGNTPLQYAKANGLKNEVKSYTKRYDKFNKNTFKIEKAKYFASKEENKKTDLILLDNDKEQTTKVNGKLQNLEAEMYASIGECSQESTWAGISDTRMLNNKMSELSNFISKSQEYFTKVKLLKIGLSAEIDTINNLKRKIDDPTLSKFLEEENAQAQVMFRDLSGQMKERKQKKLKLEHEIETIRKEIGQRKKEAKSVLVDIERFVDTISEHFE